MLINIDVWRPRTAPLVYVFSKAVVANSHAESKGRELYVLILRSDPPSPLFFASTTKM